MSFLSILNLIFLEPFKTLFEILFYITNKITISAGVSLIVLGFLTSMMLLPAYKSIHAIQEKYRILKASLKDGIADIKANHTGEERTALLKNYYKQNNYSPLISFNDFMYLLFEVPIFVALYLFIPKLSILENSMFGLISNLASPDALIKIGNFSINILPVFALIISLVSIFVYSKNHSLQSKIQLCLAPIVYFIFLYKAPSGLVFFWLVLNVFSLLNTLTFKFKKSKKYVDISLSAIGLGLIIAGIFGVDTLLPGGGITTADNNLFTQEHSI